MPSEAVCCPNCGSGEARRTAADVYVCQHCSSNFRWNDKTKTAVILKPNVCACGNSSVAFCYRCQEPCCDECGVDYAGWQDSWVRTAVFHEYAVLTHHTVVPHVQQQWGELVRQGRVPLRAYILCRRCADECSAVCEAIWKSVLQAVDQGLVCRDPAGGMCCAKCRSPLAALLKRFSTWFRRG